MNEIINTITDGLFSVFVTLGSIPIIRCQKGTAAEFVAEVFFIFALFRFVSFTQKKKQNKMFLILFKEIGQKN